MKKYRILIGAFLIIIIGFIIAPTSALKRIKNVFHQSIKPSVIVSNYAVDSTARFFRNLVHLNSLNIENQRLIKENLGLQSQLSILKEAQHENEILKKEMGFLNQKSDLKLTPANIVGRSLTGYIRSVVIDRGVQDGLKEGQAVVSQGFLVGQVKTVFPNTAEVILITDNNSLVPVVLQESRGTGLLRGGLEGLTVEDIPLNIAIKKDEQVVTSGLGGEIPLGIMVGQVQETISHEGEIFQKATVKSPISIYFLEFVFVIRQ